MNFYAKYLEPLFYEALNVNRGENGYCSNLHCRIPFLSGGLFEPIDGYEWKHNNFAIPNEVFSNSSEKGLQIDGILDIFDRYNFTMSEDEPMEREVAIDPEMLGKVFENLLEINDRKSKGAFYTPREIVHYMCQESLIAYLVRDTGISTIAIRDFILYGDFMKDEDTSKAKREGNAGLYISDELFLVNEMGEIVVDRLRDVDKVLANIRVADPAVGSGAFPLGMLNEIVRARQNITAYITISMNSYDKRYMYRTLRSPYALKYETIKNCIFAADIEPSAVDIAQLRLWLSLVIDDEISPDAKSELDGHRNPSPLPNLECNILCGNSLIDEFVGYPLINQSQILGTAATNQQVNLLTGIFDQILPELISAQDEMFRCNNTEDKQRIKEHIADLRDALIMVQLQGAPNDVKSSYQIMKSCASKPYVLWQLDFARVFKEKGGFDIIIGNPPYIGEKGNKDLFRPIAATQFGKRFYCGKMDLFYFFFHKALDIGNKTADVSFITTNYYPTAFGAKQLRKDFADRTDVHRLINFNELKVFESALGQHNMITMLSKHRTGIPALNCLCKISGVASSTLIKQVLYSSTSSSEAFDVRTVPQESLFDGEELYIRLLGVNHTSDDSVDSILEKVSASKLHLIDIAKIKQGIVSGADKYSEAHEAKYGLGYSKGKRIFILSNKEFHELSLAADEVTKFVHPIYKNSEIRKYWINYQNDQVVLYITKEVDEAEAPNIINYLRQFKPILAAKREAVEGKLPWYSLHWARDKSVFENHQKIVNSRRAKKNTFAIEQCCYYEQSDIMVTSILPEYTHDYPPKYILALLNSKVYYIWLKYRGKTKGDMLEIYGKPLEEIPVKVAAPEIRDEIVSSVDAMLQDHTVEPLQQQHIDQLIFDVFKLTSKEIQIVEELCNE